IPSQPCMQFLFVSSGFRLQLPSDSASRRTPLPSANSSYCQACSGLSPPSYSPCRAHLKTPFADKSQTNGVEFISLSFLLLHWFCGVKVSSLNHQKTCR